MMGSTHSRTPRRIYAGEDSVSVDFIAARHMGMPDPRAGTMLRDACYWFGDPEGKIQVEGPNEPIRGWRGPYDNDMSALLSSFAYPFYTFFTGRGSLFVPEMDERAFPPITKEHRCRPSPKNSSSACSSTSRRLMPRSSSTPKTTG